MTLRLAQETKWVRTDWWKWSVWLEGDPGELRNVRSVTYTLHPTFPNPVREVTNRRAKFRLDSAGWGDFTLSACVHLASGRAQTLTHELVFRHPDATKYIKQEGKARSTAANSRPAKVFLSYSIADKATAEHFRSALDARGVLVGDASGSLAAGPLQGRIAALVRQSDAVLAIRSDASSRWTDFEIATAERSGVPVIPVYIGEAPTLADVKTAAELKLRHPSEASGIGLRIAEIVDQLTAKKG